MSTNYCGVHKVYGLQTLWWLTAAHGSILATVVMCHGKKSVLHVAHVTSLPCQELEGKLNKLLTTTVSDGDRDVTVKPSVVCDVVSS